MTELLPRCLALCAFACLVPASRAAATPASPFALVSGTRAVVTPGALAAAQKTETQGQASPDGTRLAFRQKIVRLVAVTGPENDMLSFRIDGRRNPTLIVPRGATIKMLFVNTDDDMKHNIRFGAALKAYPSAMTSYTKTSVGTPELAHKSEAASYGEELTLHVPTSPGTYVYFCTVRGHALGGMVGKIIVR